MIFPEFDPVALQLGPLSIQGSLRILALAVFVLFHRQLTQTLEVA